MGRRSRMASTCPGSKKSRSGGANDPPVPLDVMDSPDRRTTGVLRLPAFAQVPRAAPMSVHVWDLYLHESYHLNANQRLHWRPENERKKVLRALGNAHG